MTHIGLLMERFDNEDAEHCRSSAQRLRYSLENDKATVRGRGPLYEAIEDLEGACRRFGHAGGHDAVAYSQNPESFLHSLSTLRRIFAQRLGMIAEMFDLTPSPEVRRLIDDAK